MRHTFCSGKKIINAEEPYPGIFTFELFSPRECAALLKAVDPLRKKAPPPNSMNKYGVVLSGTFFRQMGKHLVHKTIQPIVAFEYPEIRALKKYPYAFVVDYSLETQRGLNAHFDSAHVTLNVCLGHEFEGGELVFYDGNSKKPSFEMQHKVGHAVVHRASHVHRAKPLTSGTRTNLILWCEQKVR